MNRAGLATVVIASSMFIVCGLLLAASAAAQNTISFDPTLTSVLNFECSQDTFTVAIVIDETDPEFQGFEIFFQFDQTLVEPVQAIEGLLLQSSSFPTFFTWTNQGDGDDFVRLDVAILGGTVDGPGELAQIRFQKLQPAMGTLDWTSITFRDADNDPIAVAGEDGMIEIIDCAVPVKPTTWGQIKNLLR